MRSDQDAPTRRLERLSRLRDYDVDPNQRDPRGWTVVNPDGQTVGEVNDLIIDTERMAATYLDVELDTKLFDLRGDDPHVMIPVERAHADGKRLVVDDISTTWLSELRAARDANQSGFWERWWSRDEPRREPGGGSRIAQRVNADDVNRAIDDVRPGETVRIPLVNEEIVVERRPVARDEALRDDLVVNRAADEPPLRRR